MNTFVRLGFVSAFGLVAACSGGASPSPSGAPGSPAKPSPPSGAGASNGSSFVSSLDPHAGVYAYVGPTSSSAPTMDTYTLLVGGRLYGGLIPAGASLDTYDCTSDPNVDPSLCATYTLGPAAANGQGSIAIQWPNGNETTEEFWDGTSKGEPSYVVRTVKGPYDVDVRQWHAQILAPDNKPFERSYGWNGSSSASGGGTVTYVNDGRAISFHGDGSYEYSAYAGASTYGDGTTKSGTGEPSFADSSSKGTYVIDGFSITLVTSDGSSKTLLYLPIDGSPPKNVYLGEIGAMPGAG